MLEVQPDGPSHAISIIEADVMVDFAPSQEQLKKGMSTALAIHTLRTSVVRLTPPPPSNPFRYLHPLCL